MQRDYYAFKRVELNSSLNDLEQAAKDLENAKQRGTREDRRQAEDRMNHAAEKAVKIDPHLAYLWFEAHNSELDNSIRDTWQKSLKASAIPQAFRFTPDLSAVAHLPSLSFLLHIPFRLQKPYLSKDERDFYLLENPLRREKVFQTPMMASTSWKGALRAALWQLGYQENHAVTIRLLGNPRGSEEGQAGRLHFFPTFFDQIALEVINPHDRTTGVGARGPILIECVPQGAQGDFFVLYVPFGPFEQSDDDRRAEIADDLHAVAEGVRAMLTVYGFGAKTSSGFGIVEEQLAGEGKLVLRAKLAGEAAPAVAPPASQPSNLPRYLESPTRLHPDLRREDGTLKSEAEYRRFIESQGRKYDKQEKQLYDKAKKWWEREGQALAQQIPAAAPEPAPPEPSPVTTFTFRTLSELCDVAQRVGTRLREGGEV
jgi:CRISPR-associated protein Cmr2